MPIACVAFIDVTTLQEGSPNGVAYNLVVPNHLISILKTYILVGYAYR